jgi:hypothetical protein
MKAKADTHYQWLFVSLSMLTLGLCAQWLLLFGDLPWPL